MIISHKYRFIFLKTNKTAGTSIEIALSKFCGPDDIITPISSEDEKIRKKFGYRKPQNYLEIGKKSMEKKKNMRFYNHMPAYEVKAKVSDEVWKNYFKFCFERNPWDRFISFYYYRCRKSEIVSISDFLKLNDVRILKEKGLELYTIDGQIAVDKVCLYENLLEELESVRVRLEIPEKLNLPHAKAGFRKDKRSYKAILTVKDKSKIEKLFADEIKLLGYRF